MLKKCGKRPIVSHMMAISAIFGIFAEILDGLGGRPFI